MFDAIVVGARVAGSPLAMLLARKGYRVLLADKAGFPSDTLSTHYIHQAGVARLKRWGLLDEVAATGCPPVVNQRFDVGPFALVGAPTPAGDVTAGYAPRRYVLDDILARAAAEAGADFRARCALDELIIEDGRVTGARFTTDDGTTFSEHARIVVGADGMHSKVARLIDAKEYNAVPSLTCAYYTYWHDLPVDMVELYPRPERMIIAAPTNDGATLTICYWPHADFHTFRADVEGNFMSTLDLAGSLGQRARAAARAEKIRGTGDLANFFRTSHGAGWALVGDAGCHKDPILAQGITDSFRDAELLSEAIDRGLSGALPLDDALADYQRARDEAEMPLYEMTGDQARLQPPPPEIQQLMGALLNDPVGTSRFFGVVAQTVPVAEFFAPENIEKILAGASA